jgi:hypothetical protein
LDIEIVTPPTFPIDDEPINDPESLLDLEFDEDEDDIIVDD